MTDAPERIWVWKNKPHGETVISTPSEPYPTGSPEYIRLDLHEAAVAAARAEGVREGLLKSLAHVVAAGSKPSNRWVSRSDLIYRIRSAAEASK